MMEDYLANQEALLERLGKLIWHTSHYDEQSISFTGANIVAKAIIGNLKSLGLKAVEPHRLGDELVYGLWDPNKSDTLEWITNDAQEAGEMAFRHGCYIRVSKRAGLEGSPYKVWLKEAVWLGGVQPNYYVDEEGETYRLDGDDLD